MTNYYVEDRKHVDSQKLVAPREQAVRVRLFPGFLRILRASCALRALGSAPRMLNPRVQLQVHRVDLI